MGGLTVYKQMTSSPGELLSVMKREIGVKSTCLPFAVKAIDALNSLGSKMTESEALNAANVFLSNIQTLTQGGITAEDYDKIDMVKRGKAITASARVEAFIRAAARKGYRITDTIVPVPKADGNTTYFKENFYNGEIIYTLEDKRLNGDRKITAERLVSNYFDKFLCRLEVVDIKQNKRLVMTACEMSNEDVLNASMASESGIYKTKWEKYIKDNGYEGNRKVISEELNAGSIWNTWTSEMVAKTVIRRALKRVREALPELKDTIYAFDSESDLQEQPESFAESDSVEIPLEVVNVDLDNFTEQQKAEAREIKELWTANPKLAVDTANEIMAMYNGQNAQEVINVYYASIINIKVRKKLCPKIQPLLDSLVKADEGKDELRCSICDKEIKNEKSKAYYAEHPDRAVECYDCNNKKRGGENE